MTSLIRPPLLAGAALLLVLGGASQGLGSAKADDQVGEPTKKQVAEASQEAQQQASALAVAPSGSSGRNLILGSKNGAQPENMEQFLTAVTKDVDAYWTKAFKNSKLPAPQVSYQWIPAGQTAASACGDESGTLGDDAAAYCPGDDTIYISEKFATDIYDGALDQALPGSSQGYGRTVGDFSVAYIVAHEYGHEVQAELGLFEQYGQQLPAMAFELQADCYAGTWAKSAYQENRLEDGDVQEALDAALAVGDFDAGNPGHHGTPEQREDAWNGGFEAGDPSSCSKYLDPDLGGGTAAEQDAGVGSPQDQDPGSPPDDTANGYPQQDSAVRPDGVAAGRG